MTGRYAVSPGRMARSGAVLLMVLILSCLVVACAAAPPRGVHGPPAGEGESTAIGTSPSQDVEQPARVPSRAVLEQRGALGAVGRASAGKTPRVQATSDTQVVGYEDVLWEYRVLSVLYDLSERNSVSSHTFPFHRYIDRRQGTMLTHAARRRAINSSEISTACCSVPTEVITRVISS